jgi:acylglycerol lipase
MGEGLLSESYKTFNVPLLMTHGTNDTQTSPQGSKKFYELIPSKDKTYESFPGCYHELHNEIEPDRQKIIKTYIDWILYRCKK